MLSNLFLGDCGRLFFLVQPLLLSLPPARRVPHVASHARRGKLMIGSKMCHALLDKIKYDL